MQQETHLTFESSGKTVDFFVVLPTEVANNTLLRFDFDDGQYLEKESLNNRFVCGLDEHLA